MATPSGLAFYNDQWDTGEWEGMVEIVKGFDASGGGTINIIDEAQKGRRRTKSFFDTIPGLIGRRDPASTGSVTPKTFSNSSWSEIKVYRQVALDWFLQDFIDLGLNTEEGQRLAGKQFGEARVVDMMVTALSAIVGALSAIGSPVIFDATGQTVKTLSHPYINKGFAKMGDRSPSIKTLFMHSTPWHDLIGDAIVNREFAGGNMAIFQGTTGTGGRIPVVTDVGPLKTDNVDPTPDTYLSLGLVQDAVTIKNSEEVNRIFGPVIGDATSTPQNIKYRLVINYAYTLAIKGISWKASAVDNPDNATLAAAANWDLVAEDLKVGPGIMIKTQ